MAGVLSHGVDEDSGVWRVSYTRPRGSGAYSPSPKNVVAVVRPGSVKAEGRNRKAADPDSALRLPVDRGDEQQDRILTAGNQGTAHHGQSMNVSPESVDSSLRAFFPFDVSLLDVRRMQDLLMILGAAPAECYPAPP